MEDQSATMEGASDIFNLQAESFVNPPKKKTSDIYSPQADNGKDGVYEAVIRFIPNHTNPNQSKIQKFCVWLEDPTEEKGFLVDCPSSVGKKSILKDIFWKLKNSTSARDQELALKFSRNGYFYSLVQIVEDKNAPDLVGKIMVFKFGIKVNEKIEAQLKPARGTATNPYDLFEGKDFILRISKKQKWNNYDLCEFSSDRTAITIGTEKTPIARNAEDMARTKAWLAAESPDLGKYEYKEWTQEITDRVMKAINNIIPDRRLAEQVMGSAATTAPNGGLQVDMAQASPKSTSDLSEAARTVTPQNGAKIAAPSAGTGLDDLYSGL